MEAPRRFEPGVPSAVIAAEMGSVSGRCGGGGRPGRPVLRLPAYAPDLNPVEGILSVLQLGALANLDASASPTRSESSGTALQLIQYQPGRIGGRLAGTGTGPGTR